MGNLAAKLEKKPKAENEDGVMVDAFKPKPAFPWILVKYIGFDWIWVALASIFQGLGTAAPIFFYVVFKELTDALINAANGSQLITVPKLRELIWGVSLKMLYVAIGVGVANGFAQLFMNVAKVRIGNKIKRLTLTKLVTFEQGYYDVKQVGDILSHVNEDATMIIEAWAIKIPMVAGHVVTFVVGVIFSFVASWLQTLVMGAVIPPMIIGGIIGGSFYLVATKKAADENAKCVAVATEVVSSMKTVKSMAGESKEKQRFGKQISKLGIVSYFKTGVIATAFGAAFFAIWGIVAFSFWFSGILVTTGIDGKYKITIGDMFQVFGVSLFAVLAVAQAASEMGFFYKAIGASIALSSILHRKAQIRPYGGKKIPKEELKGEIEFKNVSFSYPSRPNIQVLKNFSIKIEAGKQIAFVGESGSGKSTVVALIENLYLPYEGTITLDGYDIKELDPIWLHQTIGIVTQEPVLFATTISDNILYSIDDEELEGLDAFDKEQLAKPAAISANAHDFVNLLPDGYETLVGERGALLSGGQKQRIAIARAIIQDPLVLLLDEATSALDNQSEIIVQDALDRLLKGKKRTSVSIAHRLSTIKDCDEIIVMKKGKIVERGTHSELIEQDGYYTFLASKQLMSMDANDDDAALVAEQKKDQKEEQSIQTSDVQPIVNDDEDEVNEVQVDEKVNDESSVDEKVEEETEAAEETEAGEEKVEEETEAGQEKELEEIKEKEEEKKDEVQIESVDEEEGNDETPKE